MKREGGFCEVDGSYADQLVRMRISGSYGSQVVRMRISGSYLNLGSSHMTQVLSYAKQETTECKRQG